ncbi:MAG: hypothetical protein IT168_22415 [Bryobacterales bacterium]|nr:hypothetical protein [Bryobacterales bacterium]
MRPFFLILVATAAAWADQLQVGRAAVVITPEPGTPMAGYYSIRLATGTHDDLQAKAIVFAKDGKKAAMVACDLVAIPAHTVEEARRLASQSTGIPGENIIISATHSHTGPIIIGRGARDAQYGGNHPAVKRFMEGLPGKIAEAIGKANAALTPARASVGVGKDGSVAFNRRFHMKDGSVGWNPGKLNPNILRVAGPIDPDVAVALFETTDGKPLATYVNYACHLDTVGGTEWSADYPYTLSKILGGVKGNDMLTLFTIGTAGNINHVDVTNKLPQKGHQEAARIGTVLAGEVLKTYTRLTPVEDAPLVTRRERIQLAPAKVTPTDVDRAKTIAAKVGTADNPKFIDTVFAFKALDAEARKGQAYDTDIQVISLGKQAAWVSLPGEVFVELGQAIKQASPFPITIVVELAHGPTTYIPNRAAFPQGNYEVVSSRCDIGSGEHLVETAVKLLKEAYQQ